MRTPVEVAEAILRDAWERGEGAATRTISLPAEGVTLRQLRPDEIPCDRRTSESGGFPLFLRAVIALAILSLVLSSLARGL
jgi:hypothetical protein